VGGRHWGLGGNDQSIVQPLTPKLHTLHTACLLAGVPLRSRLADCARAALSCCIAYLVHERMSGTRRSGVPTGGGPDALARVLNGYWTCHARAGCQSSGWKGGRVV
jgi:hypothetical protein